MYSRRIGSAPFALSLEQIDELNNGLEKENDPATP